MKCKFCKREIVKNSMYCNWCGRRQIREARKEESVPIPKLRPSGSWVGQLMVDGKRVTITAHSEKEYYAKARETKEKLKRKQLVDDTSSLRDVITGYINAHEKVLSPSTINGYVATLNSSFKNYMDKPISKIDWQRMINDESAKVAPKTVYNRWALAHASLKHFHVPVDEVKLPKRAKAERQWLDFEQIPKFLEIIKDQPCELAALLGLHSLRRSEMFALTRDMITDTHIKVYGAAVVDKDHNIITKKTNKTAASARSVPILIPRLLELLPDEGPVLSQHLNTPYKQINTLCEANGLPPVGIHGLRHSFASLAFSLGWDVKTTQIVGGWSSAEVVNEIYTHLSVAQKNANIEKMRSFYGINSEQKPLSQDGQTPLPCV